MHLSLRPSKWPLFPLTSGSTLITDLVTESFMEHFNYSTPLSQQNAGIELIA